MSLARSLALKMMNRVMANYARSGWLTQRIVSLFLHHFPGQMTCEEFGDFVSAYFEDELPPDVRRKFEFHLEACPMCRAMLADYRATVTLTKATNDRIYADAPQELINAVLGSLPPDRSGA